MAEKNAKHSPRVVMLLGSLPPMPIGGAEVQAIKLCRALNALGVDTFVITWGKYWHKRQGIFNGVKFRRLSSIVNLPFDLLSVIKKNKTKTADTRILYDDSREITTQMSGKVWFGMIIRYHLFYLNCLVYLWFNRKKFDIIHVHMMEWPAFVAVKVGRRLGKKVVIKDSTMNGISNLLRYPDGAAKQKLIAGYAYCVAMTSVIHRNFLIAGIPEQRIADIPNGIEPEAAVTRNRWSGRVLFVGNLTQQPAKGIDILLLAWKKVVAQVPHASLHVAGAGDLAAYRTFAELHQVAGSVYFLGKQNDIRGLMAQSDVFVLPSRREGMSNALMEAMLHEMPVVATRVSGSEDLIDDGLSGLLVPVADVDALAKALSYMLSHPEHARQMGVAARQAVIDKCDMTLVAQRYADLYKNITSNS